MISRSMERWVAVLVTHDVRSTAKRVTVWERGLQNGLRKCDIIYEQFPRFK